ncbi:hypothetical protein [Deferrisoma palaeochoriense]
MHGGSRTALAAALFVALTAGSAGAGVETRLLAALETHRVVVVGERHGFEPGHRWFGRVAVAAARRFPGLAVGLELPADLQPALDRGETPDLPPVIGGPSYRRLLGDLQALRRKGAVRLVALDLPRGELGDRDGHMARRVAEALAAGAPRMLALVGNLHAWGAGGKLGGRLRAAGAPCFLVGTVPGPAAPRWCPPGTPGHETLSAHIEALLPPGPLSGPGFDAVVSWAAETETARR